MCIAIHKPRGVVIKKATLETCFDSNPHGAGFAFPDGKGGVQIIKGLMDFDTFWKEYKEHTGKAMIIHFRWATHGTRGQEMTHPFAVMADDKDTIPRYAVCHNGVFGSSLVGYDAKLSDTCLFVQNLLGPVLAAMHGSRMPIAALEKVVTEVIGAGNKVLIMDAYGDVVVANKSAGTEDLGCWFSNSGYKTVFARSRNRRVHYDTEEEYQAYLASKEAESLGNVSGYGHSCGATGGYLGRSYHYADRRGADYNGTVSETLVFPGSSMHTKVTNGMRCAMSEAQALEVLGYWYLNMKEGQPMDEALMIRAALRTAALEQMTCESMASSEKELADMMDGSPKGSVATPTKATDTEINTINVGDAI